MTSPYGTSDYADFPASTDADEPAEDTSTPARSQADTEAMLQRMVRAALNHQKDANEAFRIQATKYYRGEKFGDEKPGRSDVVVTDVRDTTQQLMAPLLSILYGPISAVEFAPNNPNEIELAAQQTGYINHIFRDRNKGFLILHGALKDALVRRMGVIKYWWEEKQEIEVQNLTGLDQQALEAATMDGGEVTSLVADAEGMFSCTIVRKKDVGRIRVAGVPTERFFYNKDAQDLDDVSICGHWENRTVGDLVALGYDQKEMSDAALATSVDAETEARRPDVSHGVDDTMIDENRPVKYYEAYVLVSETPDQPPQLMKACFVGEAALKLVAYEPADDVPFALFVPDPEPHSIEGLGVADGTMDLQRINSDVARGVLNSLQLAITPRTAFVPGAVNMKDMLNTEVNALIRTRDINAIRPIEHRFLGEPGIGVLEFFRGMKEDRFGTSRAAAGLNPDALQSSTKSAVAATVSASSQRILMLAQILAETGYKQLFAGLYRLAVRHQQQTEIVRLRGAYHAVAPSMWSEVPTLRVNVGVGAGTMEDRINSLVAIIAKQEQYLMNPATAALTNPLLLRNSLAELALLSGRVDADRYWETPENIAQAAQEQANQPPPPPEPEMVIAEAQVQVEQSKLTLAEQKQHFDLAERQQRLNLEREKMLLDDDRQRDRDEGDLFVALAKIEAETGIKVDDLKIKLMQARQRTSPTEAS